MKVILDYTAMNQAQNCANGDAASITGNLMVIGTGALAVRVQTTADSMLGAGITMKSLN
jgi:hypothetical protein